MIQEFYHVSFGSFKKNVSASSLNHFRLVPLVVSSWTISTQRLTGQFAVNQWTAFFLILSQNFKNFSWLVTFYSSICILKHVQSEKCVYTGFFIALKEKFNNMNTYIEFAWLELSHDAYNNFLAAVDLDLFQWCNVKFKKSYNCIPEKSNNT